jgi:hypothetical protein
MTSKSVDDSDERIVGLSIGGGAGGSMNSVGLVEV